MLLDHRLVDLFVYPINAQCQMKATRMEQKIPLMLLSMTFIFYEYFQCSRVWAEPKQTLYNNVHYFRDVLFYMR